MSETFLALVETVNKTICKPSSNCDDRAVLFSWADSVQPEKGNETLWLLRNVRSGRVLVARNLLSSAAAELAPLVAEVKALDIPVLGVISDKQESRCLAIERELPDVPHQLYQFHYLRDLAQLVCDP